MEKDFLSIGLPKWPGVLVIGKSVTEEQAAEIILRTDDLYFSSNDSDFEKQLNKIVYDVDDATMNLTDEIGKKLGILDKNQVWNASWSFMKEKRDELGNISLNYMNNNHIVSSWVGGPHGWCNWKGEIGCNTYNIGKYPSVKEVYEDWKKIAKEFPFLDLKCQLLDREIGEDNPTPVIEYIVKKGKVKVMIPSNCLNEGNFDTEDIFLRIHDRYRERGCDIKKFKETVEKMRIKFQK